LSPSAMVSRKPAIPTHSQLSGRLFETLKP
jgi:hypothetical protein